MSTSNTTSRRRGRPARSGVAATERLNIRVTPEQRVAWERLGGTAWLLPQLDAAVRLLAEQPREEQQG